MLLNNERKCPLYLFRPGDAYIRHWTGSSLIQMMACRLFGAELLPEPMMILSIGTNLNFESKQYNDFHSRNCIIESRLRSGGHVVHVSICWINSAAWFSLLCLRLLICTGDKQKSNTYTKENGVRIWAANQWCVHHDDVIKWKHFPCYWSFVGDFTGHRWIPLTKASDAELWSFLWSAPETVE